MVSLFSVFADKSACKPDAYEHAHIFCTNFEGLMQTEVLMAFTLFSTLAILCINSQLK